MNKKELSHKNVHTNIIVYIFLAIFGLIALFSVLRATARYGSGISSDALHYVSTAENLAKGKGFYSFDGKPYTHWPPLYPSLIALLTLLGVKPLQAAAILNAISFASVVFCSGLVFAKRIKSPLLIILGAASVLISPTMLWVSAFAWTEPLFALLVILFILEMSIFL